MAELQKLMMLAGREATESGERYTADRKPSPRQTHGGAYETYFAPDTHVNLTDAVANAKKAVWGTRGSRRSLVALQKTDE